MSTPEDEFKGFQEELEKRQAIEAELESAKERFTAFLLSRGQDITQSEELSIISLATSKVMLDRASLESPDEVKSSKIKKRIQAHFFLRDYDPVWMELINEEFPGESLKDDDHDIIIEEFGKMMQTEETNSQIVEQSRGKVMSILADFGILEEDLDEKDKIALEYLTFLHTFSDLQNSNRFESARKYLLDTGRYDNSVWRSVLDNLFLP